MPYRPFAHVEQAPPDPIMGLTELFRNDSNPDKINLSIGVYQDDNGVNPVFRSVKQAERRLLEEENTKSYLPIGGEPRYGELVRELVFGKGHALVSDGRAVTLHTPGGTGALRLGAEFLKEQFPERTLWLSDPTWPNHKGVFGNAGLTMESYPYYDPETHGMRFDDMLEALERVPDGDVVLLHGCCHNPTGVDPTPEQWQKLAELFARRDLIPYFDFAYQGLGTGLEEDAVGVRTFADKGLCLLVSSSFSKNFGLYRERVGALTIVSGDADEAARVASRVKIVARRAYSNPPAHGGKAVEVVLTDPELRKEWEDEVRQVRQRILSMRELFVQKLKELGVSRDFGFLMEQKGMFSFSGIGREEVLRLREEYGIYMSENGRINVAGMTTGNIDYLCNAIARVLRG